MSPPFAARLSPSATLGSPAAAHAAGGPWRRTSCVVAWSSSGALPLHSSSRIFIFSSSNNTLWRRGRLQARSANAKSKASPWQKVMRARFCMCAPTYTYIYIAVIVVRNNVIVSRRIYFYMFAICGFMTCVVRAVLFFSNALFLHGVFALGETD